MGSLNKRDRTEMPCALIFTKQKYKVQTLGGGLKTTEKDIFFSTSLVGLCRGEQPSA